MFVAIWLRVPRNLMTGSPRRDHPSDFPSLSRAPDLPIELRTSGSFVRGWIEGSRYFWTGRSFSPRPRDRADVRTGLPSDASAAVFAAMLAVRSKIRLRAW